MVYYPEFCEDFDRIMQQKNCVQLDLSVLEHAEFFLKSHGGEELLKTKYKAVYNEFCHLREENTAQQGGSLETKDIVSVIDPPCIREKNDYDDYSKISVHCSAYITSNNVKSVTMQGFVLDTITQERYCPFLERFSSDQIRDNHAHCEVVKETRFQTLPKDRVIKSIAVISCMTKSGRVLEEIIESVATVVEAKDIYVKEIKIKDPRSKKNKDKIIVHYKYREGECDYKYENVAPEDDKVEVMLDLAGQFTLHDQYKPVGLSTTSENKIRLFYASKPEAIFNYTNIEMKEFFKINGQTVTFEFPQAWKTRYDLRNLTAELEASLECPFQFTVLDADSNTEIGIPLKISSTDKLPYGEEYYKSNDYIVYVPRIIYLWGCFGKDTKIRMADNTEKVITQICQGDWVMLSDGTSAQVHKLTSGTDSSLVHIETESGHKIALSDMHPIMTERGPVIACMVNAADTMILGDDSKSHVRFVYREDYNDQVYNLDFGDDEVHWVIADGYVAGDLNGQNKAVKADDDEYELSEKDIEFMKEYEALIDELASK